MPVLSKETLFEKNDVLIFQKADSFTLKILSESLKQSKHIMLIDKGILACRAVDELIKLREEAQTVFKIKQSERSSPALNACRSLMIGPSLIEIKLRQTPTDKNRKGSVMETLFRMIDTLLFLSPLNIKRIQAMQQTEKLSSINLISSMIEFDNGTVANLLATNISERDSFLVDIYQKKKHLALDMLNDKLKITEQLEINNKINSKTNTFKNRPVQIFYSELDNLHQAILNNNHSGRELFEIFRIMELSSRVIQKSGFSATA